MIFNSIPFILFIVMFFAGRKLAGDSLKANRLWIVLMSFVFYGFWDWRFLFLLAGTGSIDYFCGKAIANGYRPLLMLRISVVTNLASLMFFKYTLWLLSGLHEHFGLPSVSESFSFTLPVGISFYTFNSLSYTIDLYKGKAKPAKDFMHFMAFISFFPHLVAGPIIRARDILGQMDRNRKVSDLEMLNGLKTCIWGFFQKMVLADNLAVMVNQQFSHAETVAGSLQWWLTMVMFAFQIYFDFNGYSTIARGLAKMCGIHFRLNFNHPYKASSFSDFWRCWHISLSSFFRDYVYIPLGGNRRGRLRTELNRWVTMLLSGIWHGAAWGFVFWGALHALFLSLESWIKLKSKWLVFAGVVLAWVFFRAPDFETSTYVIGQMLTGSLFSGLKEMLMSNAFVILILALCMEYLNPEKYLGQLKFNVYYQSFRWALLAVLCVLMRGPEQQFIYFQF